MGLPPKQQGVKVRKVRKLKVYSGYTRIDGKQVNVAVATTSQKRAAELSGVNSSYVRNYWSVTGNSETIALAMVKPETLVILPHGYY